MISSAADGLNSAPRVAPLGMPVQQVNYANYGQGGYCPNGDCHAGGIRNWNGNSWGVRPLSRGVGFNGLIPCWGCQHGLAQGNAWVRPPAVWPVARTPNTYEHYWAPQLTGQQVPAVAYPMIYHPTDTTQLGFSYQHVPRWGYRPEMLPPAPTPYWPLGMHTAYGSGFGGYVEGPGIVTSAPTTAVGTPVPTDSPVTPAPIPVQTAPPKSGIVVPPPPPDGESAVFPNRTRR